MQLGLGFRVRVRVRACACLSLVSDAASLFEGWTVGGDGIRGAGGGARGCRS